MQKLLKRLFPLALTLLLAGCFPGVYKIDVQQGNIVDQEDLELLTQTMRRQDVHQLLGTPLVQSSVRDDREHYLYTFQREGGEIRRQRITVHYQDGYYLRHEARLLDETPAN